MRLPGTLVVYIGGMLYALLHAFTLTSHFFLVHLLLPLPLQQQRSRVAAQSFVAGQSSSLGVLPTSLFSNQAARNVPLTGSGEAAGLDCGWTIAGAGSTAPGYYTVPMFAVFNMGAGNVGSGNVGYRNIGFGNYGVDNIGRLNTGTGNVGYLNGGSGNAGAFNEGNFVGKCG